MAAVDLETDLSEADTAVSDFFAVDRPWTLRAMLILPRCRMSDLETQAIDLEDAQSDAQGSDLFFTDGAGSGHPSSAEIGAEAGLLEGLVSQFGDLETALERCSGRA